MYIGQKRRGVKTRKNDSKDNGNGQNKHEKQYVRTWKAEERRKRWYM